MGQVYMQSFLIKYKQKLSEGTLYHNYESVSNIWEMLENGGPDLEEETNSVHAAFKNTSATCSMLIPAITPPHAEKVHV